LLESLRRKDKKMNINNNKIGLLTWTRYNNYGSVLQAYALKTFILKNGYNPIFIDYTPNRKKSSFISVLKNREDFKQKVINRLLMKNKKYIKDESDKNIKFDNFRKNNFQYTRIYDYSNIHGANEEFNVFVCGSDQIWSPVVYDSNYFFKFVNEDKVKIAYAPSFGTRNINDENIINEVKKLIPRYNYLSTREKTGVDIIKGVTGLDSNLVVDPTLLLDKKEWQYLSNDIIIDESNILLCYFLGDNKEYWNDVEFIAKELGLKVYVISTSPKSHLYNKYSLLENIGIEDFLGYINAASFICTDSFHGTIFSLIYNKMFRVYKRFHDGSTKNQNSRILNIIDIVKGSSYLFDGTPNKSPVCNPLELDELNELIKESKEFLINAISDTTEGEKNEKNNSSYPNI
jgi:hypothetical protein